jgi:YD repeat-containing protein
MKTWKFLLTLLLFTLTSLNLIAQVDISGADIDLQEKTPQSPNAGSLGKFFDIPVNMATGIPKISIPLYTIKSGSITIPIVLSYHAGGVQVNDISSWVGNNWTLTAGGSVVKKTNGLDDFCASSGMGSGSPNQDYTTPFYTGLPYNNGSYNNMADAFDAFRSTHTISSEDSINKFFANVLRGFLDGEADQFNYNMPGGGGKFYYNQRQAAFQTNEIDGSTITGTSAGGWILTTKDGIIYNFGRAEQTVNPSFLRTGSYQQFLTTAWHLNYITDPVTGKEVSLKYKNYYKAGVQMGGYESRDYNDNVGPIQLYAMKYGDNYRDGDNYVLDTIFFNTGVACFITDTASRPDYGPNSLKEIKIFNNGGLLLKKINFNYYYDSMRLFLQSLQETEYGENGNSLIHPSYIFNYDTSHHLPVRLSYAQDKWGYYNGKMSNTTSIPSHPYASISTYSLMTAADRSIDSTYTKCGMLTGIKYPTGGKTVFQYENNRIGIDSLVGGMRIKRVTHIDSVAQKNLITEYAYSISPGSSISSGEISVAPIYNYDLFHVTGNVYNGLYIYSLHRIESTPINNVFPNQGSPIFYGAVEKREKSINGDLYSRHYFQRFTEAGEIYDNSIGVPHAKQLDIKDISEIGSEIYLKDTSTNTYTLIQKDSSGYNTLVNTQNAVWNVQGAWTLFGEQFSEYPGGDPTTFYPMVAWFPPSIHAYKLMPGTNVKTDQYINTMANGVKLVVPTFYEYDSTNGNLRSIKSVDSKGDTSIKMIKYASDYISTGSFPSMNYEIQSLKEYNMQGSPIEMIALLKKKDSTNAVVQSALLYEYEGLKIKKVYKVFEQIPFNSYTRSYNDGNGFYKDSHYILQQEVTAWDDEGRPLTVINNTNSITYTRDGAYDQPIAITTNASYQDVAYSSFEGTGNGGWILNSLSRDTVYQITGRKSYYLSNGNIKKTGLTNTKKYIVSYWSKNGTGSSYTVSGSSSVQEGRTVGGWTYYEHTINGIDSVTISGSSYIDELRLYPKNSEMASFCYEELLGMITQCDASNHIVYYEYSGPEKLTLIRDQDKNIIRKICYNYAGQTASCSAVCGDTAANWQNTTTATVCLTDECGYTGYQHIEQKDFNPCSATFDSTRWVTSYKPSACSIAFRAPVWANTTTDLRCSTTRCDSIGYMLQEQRDINSCSYSVDSLRWVKSEFDTARCSTGICDSGIILTSTNTLGRTDYVASYYNIATAVTYTFNVSGGSGPQYLGTVPAGDYDLTIVVPSYMWPSPPPAYTFTSGCGSQTSTGVSAIFYSITISALDCNSISITTYDDE